jgi:hypothetical protein
MLTCPFRSYLIKLSLINEEMFQLGIFRFNISRIWEQIQNGTLAAEKEDIDVKKWYNGHCIAKVDEMNLPTVNTSQPVIQAEISPGRAMS